MLLCPRQTPVIHCLRYETNLCRGKKEVTCGYIYIVMAVRKTKVSIEERTPSAMLNNDQDDDE